jgi:flagellar basal body rod protein FlgG
MYYGIQLATSGALTALYRTDALANNLANLNTVGFKPDTVHTRQRDVVRDEDILPHLPSNTLLEKLGAGVHMAPNAVDFGQGALSQTGNPLDLAIEGDGFFVLRDLADGGASGLRLSRDGRFTRDDDGRLVNASTGMPVMSVNNAPITLSGYGRVTIDDDGAVREAGDLVGVIQLTDVQNRELLTKTGGGNFAMSQEALGQQIPATGRIRQGALESSGVDAISAMMGVQSAAKSVSSNISMVAYQDRMMERAINTFARTA